MFLFNASLLLTPRSLCPKNYGNIVFCLMCIPINMCPPHFINLFPNFCLTLLLHKYQCNRDLHTCPLWILSFSLSSFSSFSPLSSLSSLCHLFIYKMGREGFMYPRSRVAGSQVQVCLVCTIRATLISRRATLICTPIISEWGFLSLFILANTWHCPPFASLIAV